jgi:RimJ/RimL family protein N-acetyltransferase
MHAAVAHLSSLRPIRCDDEGLLQQFVRELSPRSRQRRFLAGLAELPPRLSRSLSCVDGVNHVALVVEEEGSDGRRLIAEGRFARTGEGDEAEVAVTVADAWHGQGIGSRLISKLLAIARRDHVREVHALLLADNRPAVRLLAKFGFVFRPHTEEPGLLRAVRALSDYRGANLFQRLAQSLHDLRIGKNARFAPMITTYCNRD